MQLLLKIIMIFVLSFTFVFVEPKQKTEAALPLIPAVLMSALGSVVVDMAIDYGIDFVDKKAQKKWAENVVGKLWNKHSETIKNLKPTKKNAGKWALNISKGLALAILDEIGDTVEDTVKNSTERENDNTQYNDGKVISKEVTGSTDPFYNTSVNIKVVPYSDASSSQNAYAYFLKYGHIEVKQLSYEQKAEVSLCVSSDCDTFTYSGGSYIAFALASLDAWHLTYTYSDDRRENFSQALSDANNKKSTNLNKKLSVFIKYKEMLNDSSKTVYEFDDVIVAKGDKTTVQVPENATISTLEKLDDSKVPAPIKDGWEMEWDISDTSVIDAEFEVVNEGDEFEWELIEQDIVNQGDNIYKTYDYDYEPTINNYYQISDAQRDEIKNEIEIIINNEVNAGGKDDDNNSVSSGKVDVDVEVEGFKHCVNVTTKEVVSCKEIEAIDGSLLEYVANAYDYAVNAVGSAVNGLKTIVSGSAGLIALYSDVFDWLPDEVTVILTSGLLLMIGLRVFRR